MNITMPNGEPVLMLHGQPRIVQLCPTELATHFVVSSVVERGQPLSDGANGATAVTISLAERLRAAPRDVEPLLTRPIGSRFLADEEIARARKGLRGQTVLAPFTGILQTYNSSTGIALFMSSNSDEMTALVSGEIDTIDPESVSIRTSGSRAYGIIGFGRAGSGPIRLISPDPHHVVDPSEITASLRGAVVAAGPWVTAAAYRRFIEVGVTAVISGGIVESEVASAFNVPAQARVRAWRQCGAEIRSSIAVIATEGFGQLPMHATLWSFLSDREGIEAIVTPETSTGERLVRPQIIVEEAAGSSAREHDIQPGSKLRLVDHANLGLEAEAAASLIARRYENGQAVETIDVILPNRKLQTVPIANVELIF